jgi:hypothetical protein
VNFFARCSTYCLLLAAVLVFQTDRLAWADENGDFFEARIRPILVDTCFRCHGDAKTSGDLRIDSRERLLTGGESGPAIIPGKPDESLLIRAIQRQEEVSAMPPEKDKALRADQIADFVAWVKAGAVWPEKSAKFEAVKHWAFEPVRDGASPEVQEKAWIKTSVDSFIRRKQEAAGVRPAPAADKLALIRRATFDLTGLPPTPNEVAAFVQDTSPAAFETVVERLLKSPAYGERWGRHWLDVVRYADTAGETADYPVPQAWQYRNYVIDAFNADKPYDEFLREQIAGDILANQGPPERYAERVAATGYLAISRRFGFDSENYHHLTIQDTIDTLGQSVLGLSLGCARCHDHKFDALSMRDYYALYGIFDSSRYAFPGSEQKSKVRSLAPLVPPGKSQRQWRSYQHRVAELSTRLTALKQPVPSAVLRCLSDIDGDFELQAPAAGGSNGVLVPPWMYEGKIAVTAGAQSPYQNAYPLGTSGASVPAANGPYRIAQAIRTSASSEQVFVNFDFRVGSADPATPGKHRVILLADGKAIVELLLSPASVELRRGESHESLAGVRPDEWHNLQLTLDLKQRTLSGSLGTREESSRFENKPLSGEPSALVERFVFESADPALKTPAIEFDNLAIQDVPLASTSTHLPGNIADPGALIQELQQLAGIDGDMELQLKDLPPSVPWNPGPNSVVKLAARSQSPYRNLYPAGQLGMHMPNRGEYDGFGAVMAVAKGDEQGRIFASFDFCCASGERGSDGSWRWYLGHGPGPSAAIELFFNVKEFFQRSENDRKSVTALRLGQWYQVQVTLDTKAKTYSGTLATPDGKVEFAGACASGWDGIVDHWFIDSYGHLPGVRPALDADNFALTDHALPALDALAAKLNDEETARREKVAGIRKQLGVFYGNAEAEKQELNNLLAEGPFALAYGMAEGTPHNVRMQLRGEPDQPGDEVPRGFIKALGGGPLAAETAGSGRLELAQWLTRPENPLTARVMVNRIWQYHFGRGIVQTPNDFGVRGLPPTHPELLDHLATQFIRGGWSIKAMHRLIMLSATYQQATDSSAAAAPLDLYASFARRRLSAEEIRDAILVVSGELDATPGREHPFPSPIGWGYSQHAPFSAVYDHNRRSVYLMTQRLKRHPFLALFDGPDPNATTALRLATTVPTQALFFLNDPFIHAKAEKWAQRLMAASADEQQQVDQAWLRAIGRAPTESERAEATEFLAAYRTELATTHPDNEGRALAAYLRTLIGSNEFLHVD